MDGIRLHRYTVALVLLGGLSSAPTLAAGLPFEPQVSWSVSFGGASAERQPELGVGLRTPELGDGLRPEIVQLGLGARGATMRVAGLPIGAQGLVRSQNEDDRYGFADTPAARPWYTQSWLFWTAGGLAVAGAALAGGDEGRTGSSGSGDGDPAPRSGGMLCVSGVRGVPDGCVVPCGVSCIGWQAGLRMTLAALDPPRDAWLDAGTGRMGDLVAR